MRRRERATESHRNTARTIMRRHALAGAAWPALAALSMPALPAMPARTNATEHAGVVGADAEAVPRGRDGVAMSTRTLSRAPRRGLGRTVVRDVTAQTNGLAFSFCTLHTW